MFHLKILYQGKWALVKLQVVAVISVRQIKPQVVDREAELSEIPWSLNNDVGCGLIPLTIVEAKWLDIWHGRFSSQSRQQSANLLGTYPLHHKEDKFAVCWHELDELAGFVVGPHINPRLSCVLPQETRRYCSGWRHDKRNARVETCLIPCRIVGEFILVEQTVGIWVTCRVESVGVRSFWQPVEIGWAKLET